MHELSIATSMVDAACREAARADLNRVVALHLRMGVLSGVVREALEFAFDVATEGTRLEGARLEIEDVPAVVFCPQCQLEKDLPASIGLFRASCPECGTPTPDVRGGRELEITALEVED